MRILFVDDEASVLDGLQDLLRPHRRRWRVDVATSGDQALQQLERQPADVVVSDMRMPGMDGATLLSHVRDRHPDALRVVLSGHTELEAALRSISIAHQFLTKPCRPQQLIATLEAAERNRALLSDSTLCELMSRLGPLPSAPRLYVEVRRAVEDPSLGLDRVADIVRTDPAVTAKLLQLSNSSFFGRSRPTATIEEAVVYLGTLVLQSVVLMAEVVSAFEVCPSFDLLGHQTHSLQVGALASKIVGDKRLARTAYTAGVLHDVGELALAAIEQGALLGDSAGVVHAHAGAWLLGRWGLPMTIVDAVAEHHAPISRPGARLGVAGAVYVAEALIMEAAPQPVPVDARYLDTLATAEQLKAWRSLVVVST